MGTAQRQVNADSLSFTDKAGQNAEIVSLRSAIQTGGTIYATDMNRVATLINNMNGHYHSYTDAYQLATYGVGYGNWPGAGDRTNYYESKNTNNIDSTTAVTTDSSAGTAITATRHNELQSAINNIRTHAHGIVDRTA